MSDTKRSNVKGANRQIVQPSGNVIKSPVGKAMVVRRYGEVKANHRKTGHVVENAYSTDNIRKKAAHLGCAYTRIYNREREDIDLIATGLARFKK